MNGLAAIFFWMLSQANSLFGIGQVSLYLCLYLGKFGGDGAEFVDEDRRYGAWGRNE